MSGGFRLLMRCDTGLRLGAYAGACVALIVAKRLVPLPTLARFMWRDAQGPRDRRREARDVALVLTATRWTRMRGRDCLQRSLLLYALLSRRGANPALVIGFRKDGDRIAGHVWVTVDGWAIGEPKAALAGFTPCVVFGPHGSRCLPA